MDEKCPQCGVPIWYAFSSDSDIEFKLKTISCHACAHKENEGAKHEDKKPGESEVVYAVPALGIDELPPRRSYFEREAKRHMAEHEREQKIRDKFKSDNGIE